MRISVTVLSCVLIAAGAGHAQSSEVAPDPMLLEWRKKVTNAKGLEGEQQKRDAMLALLREALSPREVRLSRDTHTDQVHHADNEAAPVVNFDPRLNQKTSYQFRPGGSTRPLQGNFGYYFTVDGTPYVVLGPAALDPRSPVFTKMSAEHELFHAKNHVGDARPLADRELQTWAHMFVGYFHQLHQFNQQWAPMLSCYEDASPEERRAAVEKLAGYRAAGGAPETAEGAKASVRAAFDEWLARRKKDTPSAMLVRDLEMALSSRQAAAAPQAPADPALVEWQKKVTEAQAMTDEAGRRDALLALVRQALAPKEVAASGAAHRDQVHPDDNKAAPTVNFDVRLNEKTVHRGERRLETSPAYYFVSGGTPYVVVGPRVVDPRSPVFTKMSAEHELFHAKHHVGDPRPIGDRELETWTHVFVTWFHEAHPFKQRWAPLVSFYEDADPGERKASLDKLVAYYKTPPGADDAAKAVLRTAFDEWLARRKKDTATMGSKFVADLEKALAPAAPAR